MLSQVQRLLVYLSFQQHRFLPLLVIEEGPCVQDDVDDIDDFGDYDFNGDHYDYLNADTMIMMICRAFHQYLPWPHHL